MSATHPQTFKISNWTLQISEKSDFQPNKWILKWNSCKHWESNKKSTESFIWYYVSIHLHRWLKKYILFTFVKWQYSFYFGIEIFMILSTQKFGCACVYLRALITQLLLSVYLSETILHIIETRSLWPMSRDIHVHLPIPNKYTRWLFYYI